MISRAVVGASISMRDSSCSDLRTGAGLEKLAGLSD